MPKAFHPIRSRRFRLLASLLVMLAILCNGIGFVQAQSMPIKKNCCAEMMGHKTAPSHCAEAGKTAPSPHMNCDDQCMARCMSGNVLLSTPLIIATSVLITTPLPQIIVAAHSLAEIGPDLRPPIYS